MKEGYYITIEQMERIEEVLNDLLYLVHSFIDELKKLKQKQQVKTFESGATIN